MRSSHPPTLLKLCQRTVVDERLLERGDFVLLAVSGGPDSMALLHVMAKLAPRLGVGVAAHGVDHGLRAAATDELAMVERFAFALGVPFSSTRVDVRPGANLMARARQARYEALTAALSGELTPAPQGARYVATAHHADDRAETVLMRLLRGTGLAGLAVLPPRAGRLIRPFARARRADILAHIDRHHIPHAHDPTNLDPRFLRTRVRGELLPMAAELSPRIVEHLCDLADAAVALRKAEEAAVPASIDGHRPGRAQRVALSRALKNKNGEARVPLPGGHIAAVDLSSQKIMLIKGN
jgi:tRNA(Ile)-lysidine synthase